MTARRLHYVDVFTATPLMGNPVAVVLDGDGLSTVTMQAIARWTNLSETTFVVPSDRGDYGFRIFTPVGELPFAGHPTAGSAHAVLDAGLVTGPAVVQDCAAGLVPILQDDDGRIRAVTPRTDVTDRPVDRTEMAAALRVAVDDLVDPVVIDAGPFWLVARLPSSGAVDRLEPDLAAVAALSDDDPTLTGITVYGHDDDGRVTVRGFAPAAAVDEDPGLRVGLRSGGTAPYPDRGNHHALYRPPGRCPPLRRPGRRRLRGRSGHDRRSYRHHRERNAA